MEKETLYQSFFKRLIDIVFALIGLPIFLISFVIFAPIIYFTDKGPVFYNAPRIGQGGKLFKMYKYRSMYVNAPDIRLADGSTYNGEDDPRVTPIGRFMRKTSIDELPQFFNVWRGDMSIVGPRPHMVKHTQDYSALIDKYMLRHTIKPGITGWAQVHGLRGQTEYLWQMEKRVEYDVWYAENWNMMLDFKIVFLTVYNAIKGEKNAF